MASSPNNDPARAPPLPAPSNETNIIYAPEPFPEPHGLSVFLAGSIDQGKAIEWQTQLADELLAAWPAEQSPRLTILNPRRLDWDSSWKQEMGEQPFTDQVHWELNMQETASVIAMYFGVESAAPISECWIHIV